MGTQAGPYDKPNLIRILSVLDVLRPGAASSTPARLSQNKQVTGGPGRYNLRARGDSPMRLPVLLAAALFTAAIPAWAQEIRRAGSPQSPISSSVAVPPGSLLVYVSGTVPDPVDPGAQQGTVQRYGDTETQTRSILRKIRTELEPHGLSLGDVVMMRVFLVAPPGLARMDFAGMMNAYREFFGTEAQPNRPARSTMEVTRLVDPGWLVEIEVTAAAPAALRQSAQ